MHKRIESRGFTLIELLVVICIISLLSAILFPVFGRARENARRSSCSSNVKQMGIGMAMYVHDYDDVFPAKYYSNGGTQYWFQLLQPYAKNEQIFVCPSSTKKTWGNGQYGANTLFLTNFDDPHPKMSSIQSAASTYLIMDGGSYQIYPSRAISSDTTWIYLPGSGEGGGTCNIDLSLQPANDRDCESGRHFGGVNMLFADSHVKWLKSNVLVREAQKCTTSTCKTDKSAWNPLLDNS